MGCGLSTEDKEDTERTLREFASLYKNSDMPHCTIGLAFMQAQSLSNARAFVGSITTNTTDMPGVSKAVGDMCASMQTPYEPIPNFSGSETITIGPFSKQIFKLHVKNKSDYGNCISVYMIALSDALEPLGWKLIGKSDIEMTYAKESR
jgi:hypothetical protein